MNKISSLEMRIISILKKENISFIREKTFNDLQKGRFRFDFFLPQYNILIEVDGEQHFNYVRKFYKTISDFKKMQEHDRIKNSYALAHKIKLYRIPYWEVQNIQSFQDMIQDNFLVRTKWHNDNLKNKRVI